MNSVATPPTSPVPPRRRKSRVRWGIVFVFFIVFCGMFATHFVRKRLAVLPELRTVNIERRDLRLTVGTTGTIEPKEIVEIGATVTGQILRLGDDPNDSNKTVDVGTRVHVGTVLVQLDNELHNTAREKTVAARALAEAEVGRLRTQLEQAHRNLERAERVRSTNSESEFDKIYTAHAMAKSELAIGMARLAQAVADAKQAEITFTRTTIRSPIDGVVIDRRANIGQSVSPSSPAMFLIAKDIDRMRVRASVSETDISKVYVGQPVTFKVDAYRDQSITGRVERIQLNARMQGNFVTYDVLVGIDPGTTELLPNMTADVEFEVVLRTNAWLVPSSALQWRPSPNQIDPETSRLPDAIARAEGKQIGEGQDAVIWSPVGRGMVRPIPVRVGIDDGVLTEVITEQIPEKMPVVVGNVKRTTLARIIPSAKTVR